MIYSSVPFGKGVNCVSVIFSAVLLSLNSVSTRAASAIERSIPENHIFELSQDGETLWQDDSVYDYAGFKTEHSFAPAIDDVCLPSLGKRLGHIYEEDATVYRIDCIGGEYVLVRREGEYGDIYRKRA